ncbi:hypothetical protein BRADI_4g01825v3 [Brachypodium distachyon]|uniref:Uncharacterized protein n=1 Tax=Brachypodium distachyon TaxID=15368 RepID=A0A0Q3EHP4_BRADI|nr:hypothetical protein BRADI_4g01825v3 [Brachypodium distachyon]
MPRQIPIREARRLAPWRRRLLRLQVPVHHLQGGMDQWLNCI